MFRFKTPHLLLLLGLITPVYSYAASYCIKVNNGFGNGGTSFIAPSFAVPAAGTCVPWSGFTKTEDTVIFFTSGVACTSTNDMILSLSLLSTDPDNIGSNASDADYIQLCAQGFNKCALGSNQADVGGVDSGPAAQETCTPTLLKLPPAHA
jgi:hypothetical protein